MKKHLMVFGAIVMMALCVRTVQAFCFDCDDVEGESVTICQLGGGWTLVKVGKDSVQVDSGTNEYANVGGLCIHPDAPDNWEDVTVACLLSLCVPS